MLTMRAGRALALGTLIAATVCLPASPALADFPGTDPGAGTTTTTTVATPPPADTTTTTSPDPSSDPSTDPSSSTTTTAPADPDPAPSSPSPSSTTSTTTAAPASPPSTTLPSSSVPTGSNRPSTTTTRPSSTPTTAPVPTATTVPAPSPSGTVVVTNDVPSIQIPSGDAGAGDAGASPSGGAARTVHPSPTRPDTKDSASATSRSGDTPGAAWFDPSAAGGLLGLGANLTPAPAPDGSAGELHLPPPTDRAPLSGADLALAEHGQATSHALVLLGVSLLLLLALAGGLAVRWWTGRPARYWPA